jgi:catechol 2,3-dioxygenase-like lactoylglutathione lyase family enzyme
MIPVSLGATVLFVDDPRRSQEFYERVFGLSTVDETDASATFRFENTLIHLLRRAEAANQVAPAQPGAAPACMLTIWIEDCDEICAELAEKGVELVNGPVDQPWGIRAAIFADPDGHLWEVAAPRS